MRARSIVSASLLLVVAVLPGVGFTLEAMPRPHLAPTSMAEPAQKTDELSEISLQNIDLRLASLGPRNVLQDHDNPSNTAAHRASAAFATGGRPAALVVPAQPLTVSSQPRGREASDYWLLGLVAVMLVTYQLHRKHRFLRPKPFNS